MEILFIDDDPEDVEIFCEVIHELIPEASCQAIYNCAKLEAELSVLPVPDYIFLDGYMHPVSGKECLQRLKKIIDFDRTKVFIHSGSINSSEEQEFLQEGVNRVLRKGATFGEIRETLAGAIRK